MVKRFTPEEWEQINDALDTDPTAYGFPERCEGTALLGSFNIRELGNPRNRNDSEWEFLSKICSQFDLLAVQEIAGSLDGFRRLRTGMEKVAQMGKKSGFAAVISDTTGAFTGKGGAAERLGFIYRWPVVERMEIASDLTYDRTKTYQTLKGNRLDLIESLLDTGYVDFNPPIFVTFARQPHCVEFRINGDNPYEFMAVNAHLIWGEGRIGDRGREFAALMEILKSRLDSREGKDVLLLGDLNLNFDTPETDRPHIEQQIKDLDSGLEAEGCYINFPFLDQHQGHDEVFRSNVAQTQSFDHIAFFAHDQRLPAYDQNELMPLPDGTDYGMFNFMELFSQALFGVPLREADEDQRKELVDKAEYKISDHMPLWVRLPA